MGSSQSVLKGSGQSMSVATDSRYTKFLVASYQWLLDSIGPNGGSRAYYIPIIGWSKAYPETSGYIIPTLVATAHALQKPDPLTIPYRLGTWLLSIQSPVGWWHGGLHPTKRQQPSIFNTAQILFGLCTLHRETAEDKWLEAAVRAARWIADSQHGDGTWKVGNYRAAFSPSYYTQVAWPLALVYTITGDERLRLAAEQALSIIVRRRQHSGVIADWGFAPGASAFTHTIAYTLRGLLEAADLLNKRDEFAIPAFQALDRLRDFALEQGGRFPGAYSEDWEPTRSFTCLTGDAQLAICFLKRYAETSEARWINAATRLIDEVCATQRLDTILRSLRGAVAGSAPMWGRYMRLRYPNWAAKYFCDALLGLTRLELGTSVADRPLW